MGNRKSDPFFPVLSFAVRSVAEPSPPPFMEPQQFELAVYETYQTKDPAAPLTGSEIQGSVAITVTWGAGPAPPAVSFEAPAWTTVGAGPLQVFDEEIGGAKPIGTVSWSVVTHSIVKVEPDTPAKQSRWAITPVVQLVRTFAASDGSLPVTEVTYTASDTVKGDWFAAGSPAPSGS
jgi:hypothetical protein